MISKALVASRRFLLKLSESSESLVFISINLFFLLSSIGLDLWIDIV